MIKRPVKNLMISIFITLAMIVIIVSTVMAYSNSWDYYESTCYWEETCFLVGFHPTALGNGVSTKVNSTTWSVDTQSFGGTVFPKDSLCGTSSWVKQTAYWVDSNGNHNITGWTNTGALCGSTQSCANWYSGTDYTLYGSPHGNWYFTTSYGGDCTPVGSLSYNLLTVYP